MGGARARASGWGGRARARMGGARARVGEARARMGGARAREWLGRARARVGGARARAREWEVIQIELKFSGKVGNNFCKLFFIFSKILVHTELAFPTKMYQNAHFRHKLSVLGLSD